MLLLIFTYASAYPILESGMLNLTCDHRPQSVKFMNYYRSYLPQVIVTLHNYTNEIQFSDYAVDLHIDITSIGYQEFQYNFVCSQSTIKNALYYWYAFGGESYDAGCLPMQEQATIQLEQLYMHKMNQSVFLSGFTGFFKHGGKKPAFQLRSSFDGQNMTIQAVSTFNVLYVCYIMGLDLTISQTNDTNVPQLLQKPIDETSILGISQYQLFGSNFQFQLLSTKNLFPKQMEYKINIVKLNEPTFRVCPKVYAKCGFEGDPILVCQETVELISIWKEFKSLRLFDQKMKFKLNIVSPDNTLWIDEDIQCTYDMYDQLMEIKIRKEPLNREMNKKQKMLDILYDDSLLTGQD